MPTMALYGVVFLGTTPVGALAAGWMAQSLGPRAAFAIGGLITILATAAACPRTSMSPEDGDEGPLAAGHPISSVREVIGVTARAGVHDDDLRHAC